MLPSCALNALTAGKITPAAMATLTAVVSFVNRDRTGHPYRRTIATRTGQSISTVGRHLAQLQAARLLQVVADPYGGPSMYRVSDPCGECFTPSQPRSDPRSPVTYPPITSDLHKGSRSSGQDPTPKATSFAQPSESTTDPSPAQLDPADCQHLAADEDGYCSPCRTQLDQPPERSQPTEEPLPKADVLVAAVGDVWSMEDDEPQPDPPRAERRPVQNTMPL